MKITGVKRLLRQLDDLPDEAHKALVKSTERSAKYGATKARAIAPVLDGDFRGGINHHVEVSKNKITGFVNFFDRSGEGLKENGLAANAINYGWTREGAGTGHPANTRAHTLSIMGKRHQRAVSRQLKKAIQEALKHG